MSDAEHAGLRMSRLTPPFEHLFERVVADYEGAADEFGRVTIALQEAEPYIYDAPQLLEALVTRRQQSEYDSNIMGGVAKVFGYKPELQDAIATPTLLNMDLHRQPEQAGGPKLELSPNCSETAGILVDNVSMAAIELRRATDATIDAKRLVKIHAIDEELLIGLEAERQKAEREFNIIRAGASIVGAAARVEDAAEPWSIAASQRIAKP